VSAIEGGSCAAARTIDDLRGCEPRLGVSEQVEDPVTGRGALSARLDLLRQELGHRLEASLEHPVDRWAQNRRVAIGRQQRRVPRRPQKPSHRANERGGTSVVRHAQYKSNEDLLDERPHPREEPERPANGPPLHVGFGNLPHRVLLASDAFRGECRRDALPSVVMTFAVATEHRARRGLGKDLAPGLPGV